MPKTVILEQGQGHRPSGYIVLAYTFAEAGRRKACFVERETRREPYGDWDVECVDSEEDVKRAAERERRVFLDTRGGIRDT